jgi:cytochrome c oxidase subunit 2
MYIQQVVEMFYLTLVAIYIVFIISFIYVTSRGKPSKMATDGGEEEHRGMDKAEKTWFAILITIAIIGNALLLSPLIPSANMALWTKAEPMQTYTITIEDYQFHLPEKPMRVAAGVPVEFVVLSNDVTYGFGVFREDGSLVFQMQVVPGYENKIVWIFDEPGVYTIRSTEYSGPEHSSMVVYDAIVVEEGG